MLMKTLISLTILVMSVISCYSQITINNVVLPAEITYDGNSMVLNGGGIRTKLIFKLYTGGLYLAEKNDNAEVIIKADEPMTVRLAITSNKINSNNFSEAIREGFEKSTGNNTAPIQGKIDKLIETFSKEPIIPGDVFDVVWVPEEGVKTYKRGVLKSTIPGLEFKHSLFGIWLSDDPVSTGLKNGMLGK